MAQKPLKEEKPQVLAPVPDAPAAVKIETARFSYLAIPSEDRGLLSKQVEESLKNLRRALRKRRLARITAWVGGAGDVRRVSTSIREQLAEWRLPIPAITVIRVGALANPGSRVAFDIEVEEENAVNSDGLLFLAAERSLSAEFRLDLKGDFQRVLGTLDERLRAEGVEPAAVIGARCFVSLSDDLAALDRELRQRYPAASASVMQALRTSPDSFVNCDLVARLAAAPSDAFEARIATLEEGQPPVTTVVKVNTPRLVLTSAQLCFRATDADLALGFERLQNTLEEQGTSLSNAAQLSILAQSPELGIRAEQQGRKFLNPLYDPAILRQTVEALPALDSTISLDAIVAVPE
ncbi:MAG: hypothetical protein KIT83_19405 [Bryobacterales bacterium]|nr:hypothetical protein [Bryobacterales bacterium]